MRKRRRSLVLSSGPYRLPAELWEPVGGPAGGPEVVFVLCHGSTQKGMRHELIRYLASSLSSRWPVLAFDLPGLGRAPRLIVRGLDDYLYHEHPVAAAELAMELTGLPSVLVGHSMGGRVVLQAASRGQEEGLVVGVATLAGLYELPADPAEMEVLLADFASYVRVGFELPMDHLAREVAEARPTHRAVERLRIPLLAVEAGRETYGFIRESRYEIFRMARCPKTLILLGGADHKFKGHHRLLPDLIARWAELRLRGREGN